MRRLSIPATFLMDKSFKQEHEHLWQENMQKEGNVARKLATTTKASSIFLHERAEQQELQLILREKTLGTHGSPAKT